MVSLFLWISGHLPHLTSTCAIVKLTQMKYNAQVKNLNIPICMIGQLRKKEKRTMDITEALIMTNGSYKTYAGLSGQNSPTFSCPSFLKKKNLIFFEK